MARFGGAEVSKDNVSESELPPVGSAPGVEDYGMDDSDMLLGPGISGEDAEGPVGAFPGTPSKAVQMTPWMPSPSMPSMQTPQAATTPIGGYVTEPTGTTGAYYSMTAPPSAQQKTLISYDISSYPPTSIFSPTAMSMVTAFPLGGFGPSPWKWIITAAGWQWYAVCPQNSWATEVIYVHRTGRVYLYEIYPNGLTATYNYGVKAPGYYYMWFFADMPGRHINIVTVGGKASNAVTIDVI